MDLTGIKAVGAHGYVKRLLRAWETTLEAGLSGLSNDGGTYTGTVVQPAGSIIPAVAGTAITKTGSRTFLTVASANADHWVTLPAPVIGDEIWLKNGATGYEIRSSAPATIAINGGTGATVESAVIANQLVRLVCVSATAWIATNFHTDGTVSALEAAA